MKSWRNSLSKANELYGLGSLELRRDGERLVLQWKCDGRPSGIVFTGLSLFGFICSLPYASGHGSFSLLCFGVLVIFGLCGMRVRQVTTTFDLAKHEVARVTGPPNNQPVPSVLSFADIKALKIETRDDGEGAEHFEVALILKAGKKLIIAEAPKRMNVQRDQDKCFLVVREICAVTGVSVQEPR